MDSYRKLLEQIRDHLRQYDVPGWPARLDKWLSELDQLDPQKMKAHLLRSQRSLGGMGSISDIVICPEAGHKIAADEHLIKAANGVLLTLVEKLDAEVSRRLAAVSN